MFPDQVTSRALAGFEILERIGAGGAGQVFLARSRGGKLVAIKVLSDETARDAEFAAALVREASMCARLSHTAIVQVRAFVESEGFAALVFEYVPGVALARLLRHLAAQGVRLPDRAAWHIVERVSAGLAYAHAQRDDAGQPAPIVHRDVSPSNVLVDWTGDVKLADFGIAKMIGVSPATRMGLVRGTLGCMAPEQARGEEVTERADVYAAALLAWRLATGRDPFTKFKDDDMELLRAMRNPRLRPLSQLRADLPRAVLDAIASALSPDPKERSITASELSKCIRANIDLGTGPGELERLLARWRPALEATVARDGATNAGVSATTSRHTARYEELALAFDNQPIETSISEQALPSSTDSVDDGFSSFDLPRILPSEPPFAVAQRLSQAPAPPPAQIIHLPKPPAPPSVIVTVRPDPPSPPPRVPRAIVAALFFVGGALIVAAVLLVLFAG